MRKASVRWSLNRPRLLGGAVPQRSSVYLKAGSFAIGSALVAIAASATIAVGQGGTSGPGGGGGSNSSTSGGQSGNGSKVGSLVGVKPLPVDTSPFIKDQNAAAQLGKALFWDTQAGSDNQACASCHYHSGADIRIKNAVNPGFDEAAASLPQWKAFGPRKSDGTPTGPNVELSAADFPFKTYLNPADRHSTVLYETNDRFGSSGTFAGDFENAVSPLGPTDEKCRQHYDETASPFHKNGYIARRNVPRNTPTNVNSAYSLRLFWDGRANSVFNGQTPFGLRDQNATVQVYENGKIVAIPIAVANAALASQAVGPILSDNEMSCDNRQFINVGKKLLSSSLVPLGQQRVHPKDSLLGGLAKASGNGLTKSYSDLIKAAFVDKYYAGGSDQMVQNFSLFWGLAIMTYEARLVSDQTRLDTGSLTDIEKKGQSIFEGKGNCTACHSGPLLTRAAYTTADGNSPQALETVQLQDGTSAIGDRGFRNIGVRPTGDDRGQGGSDPFGFDLSYAREFILKQAGRTQPDVFNTAGVDQKSLVGLPKSQLPRDAVDGAFKIPGLRNVALTPPYFHNGGAATLEQVVEFYNRGGDRSDLGKNIDSSGTQGLKVLAANGKTVGSNVDTNIKDSGLSFSADDKAALVAFLKSLTDNRVACHAAPFDHPSLPLSLGHVENFNGGAAGPGDGTRGTDQVKTLPATGANGLTDNGKPCFPNSGNLFGETQTIFQSILE